jgi:hypothetical protein
MAYSENIKKLAVSLCQDGQSPEDVAKLFSKRLMEGQDKGYAFLKKLAESKSLAFTEIDWQELNEGMPEGKTIRGWYSRNKSKTAIRDLKKEPLVLKEKELDFAQQEHIRKIQNLARKAFDSISEYFPDIEEESKSSVFYKYNSNMVKVLRRLTGDFEWGSLKEHLGEDGLKIEKVAYTLDDGLPGLSAGIRSYKEYTDVLFKAYQLIKDGRLKIITETCDTQVWKRRGLQPRCKHCPDQGNAAPLKN